MIDLAFAALLLAQPAAEAPAPRTALSDLAWLEGCWEGTGFGNVVEECWMDAPDGRLTCMFQMIGPDGAQVFSEIFVLDEFEDGPAVRLKHFNADMTGWEAQDAYVVFQLLETGEDFARFEGLDYRRDEEGRLIVDVAVSRDGETATERLVLERTR